MNHSRTDIPTTKLAVVAVLAAAALVLASVLIVRSDRGSRAAAREPTRQVADLGEPNDPTRIYSRDAVRVERRDDGATVTVVFPRPEPGSYEYPTADMVPPDADAHPPISTGDGRTPEVFTLWLFVFNQPDRCTDDSCDIDDIAAGADAQGGVYQLDGRLATTDPVAFEGSIRIGQQPDSGAPLVNPLDAELHIAVAAHGRALAEPDIWRQLNGTVGNPTLWWAAALTVN